MWTGVLVVCLMFGFVYEIWVDDLHILCYGDCEVRKSERDKGRDRKKYKTFELQIRICERSSHVANAKMVIMVLFIFILSVSLQV